MKKQLPVMLVGFGFLLLSFQNCSNVRPGLLINGSFDKASQNEALVDETPENPPATSDSTNTDPTTEVGSPDPNDGESTSPEPIDENTNASNDDKGPPVSATPPPITPPRSDSNPPNSSDNDEQIADDSQNDEPETVTVDNDDSEIAKICTGQKLPDEANVTYLSKGAIVRNIHLTPVHHRSKEKHHGEKLNPVNNENHKENDSRHEGTAFLQLPHAGVQSCTKNDQIHKKEKIYKFKRHVMFFVGNDILEISNLKANKNSTFVFLAGEKGPGQIQSVSKIHGRLVLCNYKIETIEKTKGPLYLFKDEVKLISHHHGIIFKWKSKISKIVDSKSTFFGLKIVVDLEKLFAFIDKMFPFKKK